MVGSGSSGAEKLPGRGKRSKLRVNGRFIKRGHPESVIVRNEKPLSSSTRKTGIRPATRRLGRTSAAQEGGNVDQKFARMGKPTSGKGPLPLSESLQIPSRDGGGRTTGRERNRKILEEGDLLAWRLQSCRRLLGGNIQRKGPGSLQLDDHTTRGNHGQLKSQRLFTRKRGRKGPFVLRPPTLSSQNQVRKKMGTKNANPEERLYRDSPEIRPTNLKTLQVVRCHRVTTIGAEEDSKIREKTKSAPKGGSKLPSKTKGFTSHHEARLPATLERIQFF